MIRWPDILKRVLERQSAPQSKGRRTNSLDAKQNGLAAEEWIQLGYMGPWSLNSPYRRTNTTSHNPSRQNHI